MKWGILAIILLIGIPTVTALQGPFNFQGGEYYVVTSTDTTEDTGDEVCAKAGKVCIGYTEKTSGVCKMVHPSAKTRNSVSGDASGTYCNGPPQKNVCASEIDTCLTCLSCTNSVDCSTAIGGLYREMYVECGGAPTCPATMNSRNTQDLLNEVIVLNNQLMTCPAPLPGRASSILSNGNIQVDIAMKTGKTESLTVVIANKQITGISRGTTSCKQKVSLSEATLDTILGSRNRATAVMNAYATKTLKVSGCTFFRKIGTAIATPFTRFFVKRSLPPPPPPNPAPNCGAIGEQCNNRACLQGGVCAAPYEYINGQWRSVNYRCIPISEWNAKCQGYGNTRAPWACITSYCR